MKQLSGSSSSSWARRNKVKAADMETQVAELEQEAARQTKIVRELWIKIHEMQEEERSW